MNADIDLLFSNQVFQKKNKKNLIPQLSSGERLLSKAKKMQTI